MRPAPGRDRPTGRPGSGVHRSPGGATEGNALVSAADVVSFTGSTPVGRAVAGAATARGVPVQAEMGGLNAALVLPDADIEQAAGHIAASIAGYAGQKCTATSRVIAVGTALAPLREALSEALRAVPVGDPADAVTVCGPLIHEGARDQVVDAWKGLPTLAGGTMPEGPDGSRNRPWSRRFPRDTGCCAKRSSAPSRP